MGMSFVARDVREPEPSFLEKLPNELLQKIYLMSQNSFLAMTNRSLADRLATKGLQDALVRTIFEDQSRTLRTDANGPCGGCIPFTSCHLRHQFQDKDYCPHTLYRQGPRTRARLGQADFALSALLCQPWFTVPASIMATNVFEWRDNNIYWLEMLVHGPWTSARARLLWYCMSHPPPARLVDNTTPPVEDSVLHRGILEALVEKCWPALALLVRDFNLKDWTMWQSFFPFDISPTDVVVRAVSDPGRKIIRSKACSDHDLLPAIHYMQRFNPYSYSISSVDLQFKHVEYCVRYIEEAPALYSFVIRTSIRHCSIKWLPLPFSMPPSSRETMRRIHDIMKACTEKFNVPREALDGAKRFYGYLVKSGYFPFQGDDVPYLNVYDANLIQWCKV